MRDKQQKHKSGFIHARIISIISISLVLFLLGIISMFVLVGYGLKDHVRESVSFTIELKSDASESEAARMIKDLESKAYVKEVAYISKEDALKELTEELGESPEEFLGWNPLNAFLEVKVKGDYVANADSLAVVEAGIRSYAPMERLSYKKDLLEKVNSNIKTASYIVFGFAIVLLAISFFLISNTLRLVIYSRRFSIYTMKLVGATPGFIRRPFIRYNIVSALIASSIAVAGLGWLWFYATKQFPVLSSILSATNGAIVIGTVFGFGLIIALVSSFFAVNKYLRMDVNRLYKI